MPTFAEIQEEIKNMLDIPDDELDAEQKAAMNAYLDELAKQEADKIDSFAQFIRLESERAEATRKESQRLAARARTAENNIAYLKNRYTDIMLQNGLKKINGAVYTLSVRKSEKVSAPESPEGLEALPDIYKRVKTTVEPDKTTIKEALKGGLAIPGCSLREAYSLQVR